MWCFESEVPAALDDIQIIPTLGHMPGHISLYLPQSKNLIAANAVVVVQGELELFKHNFTIDLDQAVAAVQKLQQLEVDRLICYHGGLVEQAIGEKLERLVAKYTPAPPAQHLLAKPNPKPLAVLPVTRTRTVSIYFFPFPAFYHKLFTFRYIPMILPAKLLLILFLPLSVAFSALHHGWSNYDQTTTLDFTGQVEDITYENPHGLLKLEHENKTWTVFLAPPSRMSTRGLAKDMVKAGDKVRVVGYPHKEVKDEMRAERIYVGDKKIELR